MRILRPLFLYLILLPTACMEWDYGLEEDFNESNETPETYFAGVSVALIEEFTTKYNTTSYNVVIHE